MKLLMTEELYHAIMAEIFQDCVFKKGSKNSIDYENFIEHVLLPKINLFPEQYSVLILDNASIHKSQYLRDLCEENGV
ncbi:3777_t:CDS:2 [Dentiscutata heterogama]|uniref:3777_t:CDS:1 n=1 Tax=Dentiscutata heterogama TaxID=1316150 RepID=A0ACA9NKN7_9GLOM|nr:3777_t:CDS:2 [Dentiscutata heterogama]